MDAKLLTSNGSLIVWRFGFLRVKTDRRVNSGDKRVLGRSKRWTDGRTNDWTDGLLAFFLLLLIEKREKGKTNLDDVFKLSGFTQFSLGTNEF